MFPAGSKVELSWDPIEGAKDYLLEVRNPDGGTTSFIAETLTADFYEFIPDGTGWYFWRVKARLSDYEESLWSSSNRFKVVKPAALVNDLTGNDCGVHRDYCYFSSIVDTGSGRLIVFYNAGSNVFASTSDDNGITWLESDVVTKGAIPKSVVSSDGKLWLMVYRDSSLYLTSSEDSGMSWSEETKVNLPSGSVSHVHKYDFDYDDSGKMVIFYKSGKKAFITISYDEGITWSEPQQVESENSSEYKVGDITVERIYSVNFMNNGDIWLIADLGGKVDYPGPISAYNDKLSKGGGLAYRVGKNDGSTWSEWQLLYPPGSVPGYNIYGTTGGHTVITGLDYGGSNRADVAVSPTGQVLVVAGGTDDERSIWYKYDEPELVARQPFKRFSPYMGKNELPQVGALKDGKFGIIWKSGSTENADGTYKQSPSIRYGVIDHQEDIEAPPVIGEVYKNSCLGNQNCPLQGIYHTPGNPMATDKVLFKAKVADHDNVAKVELLWSLDDVEQQPISMTDSKKFNSGEDSWSSAAASDQYGSRVYAVQHGPFAPGSVVKYQISATDILGNTVEHPLTPSIIEVPTNNPFIKEIDITGFAFKSHNKYKHIYWGVSRTTFDSKGNLFAILSKHDRYGNLKETTTLNKYDLNGLPSETFELQSQPHTDCGPHDVAVDGQDNIYTTDSCKPMVHKYTPSGDYIESYSPKHEKYWQTCNFRAGGVLEIDKNNGDIYLSRDRNPSSSSSGYGFLKLKPDGTCDESASKKLEKGYGIKYRSTVQSIVLDDDGNIYIADVGGYNQMAKWKKFPVGSRSNIHKFAPDGTLLARWGPAGSGDGEFAGNSSNLISLAIGKDGFLYATDSGKNDIKKFTLDGEFVSKWKGKLVGGGSPDKGFFSSLRDISIDPVTGNIYLTDSCNKYDCRDHKKRIQVFNPF